MSRAHHLKLILAFSYLLCVRLPTAERYFEGGIDINLSVFSSFVAYVYARLTNLDHMLGGGGLYGLTMFSYCSSSGKRNTYHTIFNHIFVAQLVLVFVVLLLF